MGAVLSTIVIDSAEPLTLARWWAQVLDWHVEEEDEDEVGLAPHEPTGVELLFVRVPEGKTVKNRLHLDIRPPNGSNQAAELDRLLALGATPTDVGQGPDVSWHVLADPEGNEFCLLSRTPGEVEAWVPS